MSSLIVMHNSQIMLLEMAVKNVSNYCLYIVVFHLDILFPRYLLSYPLSLSLFFFKVLMISKSRISQHEFISTFENIGHSSFLTKD